MPMARETAAARAVAESILEAASPSPVPASEWAVVALRRGRRSRSMSPPASHFTELGGGGSGRRHDHDGRPLPISAQAASRFSGKPGEAANAIIVPLASASKFSCASASELVSFRTSSLGVWYQGGLLERPRKDHG